MTMLHKASAALLILGLSCASTTNLLAGEQNGDTAPEPAATEAEKDWLDSTAETTQEFFDDATEATSDAIDAIKDKWNELFGEDAADDQVEVIEPPDETNEEALDI